MGPPPMGGWVGGLKGGPPALLRRQNDTCASGPSSATACVVKWAKPEQTGGRQLEYMLQVRRLHTAWQGKRPALAPSPQAPPQAPPPLPQCFAHPVPPATSIELATAGLPPTQAPAHPPPTPH